MHNRLLQQLTLATSLLLTGFMPAEAQIAPLSPVPQIVQWGDPAFANTTAFTLQGEATADADAVAALKNNLKITSSGMPILIGEVGDDAVKAYEASVPTQAEGYYLSVATDKVIIAGRDSVGTFYGVQTFLQMMKEPSVMACTIKDYPSVSARGVVEGFYGNPWSQTDRKRQFEFYGANKLNTYIYGPKDDIYHRDQWKVNYPQAEANKLKELVETANHNKVRFVWAIHPGNSISWSDSDNDGIVDDFIAVKNKLQSVYDLGVREFAVFFDDISGVGKNAANQAKLINYLDSTLRKVHPDIKPFILCPTEYNKAYTGVNDTYLTTLGTDMVSSACIMWTGNSVVDMINKSDMQWINTRIKRNAYIWLNYPVTDYCTNHMLMGPTYGNDTNIASMVSGFTSNPMEYAEASKVSLFSIADYCWNMPAYDSNASWQRAIDYLWPAQKTAFKVFCRNNVDLGSTAHGLRRANESPEFAPIIKKYVVGKYNKVMMDSLESKLDTMVWAANTLLADTTQPELRAEIAPWLQVMDCVGGRGLHLVEMARCLQQSPIDSVSFMDHYLALDSLYNLQTSIRSRDFEGSIKKPNPVVANEVLAPFLKTLQGDLVAQYRKVSNYRTDLLPELLLEDGRYYILNGTSYLTNKSSNTGNPVFQTAKDNANPQRQEWNITLDAQSGRYKITSAYNDKYVNELGNFGTNEYLSDWNTYNISMFMNKYAVQNAQSAGTNYWVISNNRINKGSSNVWSTDNYIFTLDYLDGKLDSSSFVLNEPVYIIYQGKYLTASASKAQALTFKNKKKSATDKTQLWIFSIDTTTKRIKLVNAGNRYYVNEKGVFGTNAYYPSWNTYGIRERNGKISIQNQGDAGTEFWSVSTANALQKGGVSEDQSYIFQIVPKSATTGISTIRNSNGTTDTVYNLNGQLVRTVVKGTPATEGLSSGIYVINGRKVVVK